MRTKTRKPDIRLLPIRCNSGTGECIFSLEAFLLDSPVVMSSTRSDSQTRSPIDLSTIKERLRAALPHLRDEYAVERLYLHGSRVRGEATPESDLDVLVDFEDSDAGRQMSLLDFIALKQELEDLLDVPVDLGERSALGGPAGETIRKEAEPV